MPNNSTANATIASTSAPSRLIPLNGYSPAQKNVIARICEVLKSKTNLDVKYSDTAVSFTENTPQTFQALDAAFSDLLERLKSGEDLSTSKILTSYRSNHTRIIRENDPKKKARLGHKKNDGQAKPTEPLTHVMEKIGADQIENLPRLLTRVNHISRLPNALNTEFAALRIAGIRINSDSLDVLFPVYADENKTTDAKKDVLRALNLISAAANSKKLKLKTDDTVRKIIKSISLQTDEKISQTASSPTSVQQKFRESSTHQFTITELNGHSARPWADEIDRLGRSASLRAFVENPDFGFDVSISRNGRVPNGFTISFPITHALNFNNMKLALYTLEQFKNICDKLPTFPNKADTTKIIRGIWDEINTSSEAVHGDFLSIAFKKQAWTPPRNQVESRSPTLSASFEIASEYTKPAGKFGRPIKVPALTSENGLKIGNEETIMPSPKQWEFISAMRTHDVVAVHGPAGTGKTMFAAYEAMKGLADGRYERVCLTAPAVEAGEQLGFQKGTKDQKMHEHVVQILEHMEDIIGNGNRAAGKEKLKQMITDGIVEIAPHAFNRGRNYKNTFYILDENQNALWKQIVTAFTRINHGSTFVFMGDDKQNDRTFGRSAYSHFIDKISKPEYAEFVKIVTFGTEDIRRHPLIKMFIEQGDDTPPPELNERQAPRYGQNTTDPSSREVALSGPNTTPSGP